MFSFFPIFLSCDDFGFLMLLLTFFLNPSVELKQNNSRIQEIMGTWQVLYESLQFWSKALMIEKCYQMVNS